MVTLVGVDCLAEIVIPWMHFWEVLDGDDYKL